MKNKFVVKGFWGICFLLFFMLVSLTFIPSGNTWWQYNSNNGAFFSADTMPEHVAGEILVKFKEGTSVNISNTLHTATGATKIKEIREVRIQHIELPLNMSVENAIQYYMADPNVEYAEPNYIWKTNIIPNDPDFSKLWGLNNTGQTGGTFDADIDAPEAWDTLTGSRVVIAVIDTGVNYNHLDLKDNVWTNSGEICGNKIDDDKNGYVDDCYGWDFVGSDGYPLDENGHGTHVAGTIAARGNNGIGVAGVMWSARIMSVRFLNKRGSGTTANAVSATIYAANNGARVMNASWGGGGYSQALYDAIDYAKSKNALFIAAAGNSSSNNDTTPQYPSSYNLPNIIAVAATDHNDKLASFSNYGPTSVDVAAPGVNIYSTYTGAGNNVYTSLSGTSMATPHVSGVAGLVLSLNTALSYSLVKDIIFRSVDVKPTLLGLILTGGRVNLQKALLNALNVPNISANPTSKNFGSVTVGTVSPPQTFVISNTGTANLVIGLITKVGLNKTEFGKRNDTCSNVTLAPSGTCTVDAKFGPISAGVKVADLAVPSNDPNTATLYIVLTGTGVVSTSTSTLTITKAGTGTGQ
ncbi:MAG: S8 family serine peptidase [Nitrospirae bacterium]|nr:S8 family serine peptidase [Nitrospirota bacterium]